MRTRPPAGALTSRYGLRPPLQGAAPWWPLLIRQNFGNRSAAEERGEVRSDRARRVGRRAARRQRIGVALGVGRDEAWARRTDQRRGGELAALGLGRAARRDRASSRHAQDLLATEGVVAVVTREDLALGAGERIADRKGLQISVAAVRVQPRLVDRQALRGEDRHLPREVQRRALSRLERQEVGGR